MTDAEEIEEIEELTRRAFQQNPMTVCSVEVTVDSGDDDRFSRTPLAFAAASAGK